MKLQETEFEIIPLTLLEKYRTAISENLSAKFEALTDSELSVDNFSFYTSVSAVFSSKIEGENIELDSFVKHKLMGVHFRPDHTQKIDDLYDGRIEYVACAPGNVATELDKLFYDIALLINAELNINEVFFFASFIHLVFVKIHPFNDGNGRSARLIEKWFLAQKLGSKAWLLQSERYYYDNHHTYYANIRKLGLEYEFLDYSQALPFLLMLPDSL